ncbi:MAG TPA: chorismate synthase [Candidatus Butyricimonas faecavium]|nr:chorismate synthase [Candidatus Butyricimonas faecavium]
MNTIGKLYTLTSFGESHGEALGGVIDGCPAGVPLSVEEIQYELDRRRPGQSSVTTSRTEEDRVEILSGVFEGVTTGTPIGFIVRNKDRRSRDYDKIKDLFRPSHADYTMQAKYGIRDYRGGGRSSAREHVVRVVGGAVARQVLKRLGVFVHGYTSQVGPIVLNKTYCELNFEETDANVVRCPDSMVAREMELFIQKVQEERDSVGGVVSCIIRGVPVGVGEPVFDRFQARLGYYMMGINAAKGFEYGEGFRAASMRGSEHNDAFVMEDRQVRTLTNHAGGILGGITNGEDIYFRVAFKPVATIGREQQTVNCFGEEVTFMAQGRHDPCVVPRAVPVVEAMAAMLVLDMMLEAGKVSIRA